MRMLSLLLVAFLVSTTLAYLGSDVGVPSDYARSPVIRQGLAQARQVAYVAWHGVLLVNKGDKFNLNTRYPSTARVLGERLQITLVSVQQAGLVGPFDFPLYSATVDIMSSGNAWRATLSLGDNDLGEGHHIQLHEVGATNWRVGGARGIESGRDHAVMEVR